MEKSDSKHGGGRLGFSATELPEGIHSEESLILHGLNVFKRYNAEKINFLYDQLPPKKKIVFDLVPLLLHYDCRGLLPDDEACLRSPHGVYRYESSPRIEHSFARAFPYRSLPKQRYRASYDPNLPIRSVSLIGSLGSVAQNYKSDFDFWVALDPLLAGPGAEERFFAKARLIEKWADRFADAEVHIFPVDLVKMKRFEFGQVRGDASGTAQGKLLVEELYRSMTLLAGQIPIWWILPPNLDDREYNRLAAVAKSSYRLDSTQFLDEGNVHDISLEEFYGAAIWHINKTIGSPFKSILKLAVLEEYLFNQGQNGLLCDELKARLQQNVEEAEFLDPYLLMFDRASRHLLAEGRYHHLDLLRRALYMKSGAKLSVQDYLQTRLPRKKRVMLRLVHQWGWDRHTLSKLNSYRHWSFQETKDFSDEVNRFIRETYRRVTAEMEQRAPGVRPAINQRDLNVLGRKLYIFYSRRDEKVDSLRNVIEQRPALYGLTLNACRNEYGEAGWEAYRGFASRENIMWGDVRPLLLKRAPSLAGILIWLVTNQLYSHDTSIQLNVAADSPNPGCTLPDIQGLLDQMASFFPILKLYELDEQNLLQDPRIIRSLVVINLDDPDNPDRIVTLDVCSQNSWGEFLFTSYEYINEGIMAARELLKEISSDDSLPLPDCFKVYAPPRQFNRRFLPDLYKTMGLTPSGRAGRLARESKNP